MATSRLWCAPSSPTRPRPSSRTSNRFSAASTASKPCERGGDLIVEHQRLADCKGGCPLVSLTGELAEARPDCRSDLADGFDQWETAIRDGLRAMHLRGDLQRSADPDRLATALFAALQGGLLLAQVRRDTAPLEAALDTMLEHLSSLAARRRTPPTQPPDRTKSSVAANGRRRPKPLRQ